EVITTDEHRWLRHGGPWWARTRMLRAGRRLRYLRYLSVGEAEEQDLGHSPLRCEPVTVEAIERGRGRGVVDIQTSTHTFFAAGLATHNCYARTSHAFLSLDVGDDFSSKIFVKVNVAEVLRRELGRPSWGQEAVAVGTATDPYQAVEGRYRL